MLRCVVLIWFTLYTLEICNYKQCIEVKYGFQGGDRDTNVGMNCYESDMMDPKINDEATLLGKERYDVPDSVDTSKTASYIQRFYFGLTIIRMEMVFENANGEDLIHTLDVDHNYHRN